MKKLLSILFVVVAFVATSCSSGDDGPSAPPKIDVTKLYGEWKQMPEQYSDGTDNDEEYYHSLVVSDNLTFTGLWNEGYDKDSDDGRYEYSRVSGRIVVDGDKLALHQNFYDEDGEFDETEIMDGLEVIALTDDILVVRESYTNNGFVYAYRDYGFYREHAADMLPTLGYVCNLQSAEIRVYDSSGNIVNGNVSCDYAGCTKTFTVKVYVRTFDGTEHEFKDVYLSVSEDYAATYKFVNASNTIGTSNEVNVNIEQNYDSYSRSNTIKIWTYGVADGYFFPEKTITIYQSGKPSSGDNTGGSTGGGSSSGGDGGATPESEWVQVSDSPGKMPYWYCPTDGETIPAHPLSKNYTTYKNTRTGAYKIKYGYDEYTVKKGYNKISIDTESHSVYDSKYGFWKSCLDRYYIECTVY